MNTEKTKRILASICGLVTIALLTACGGGGRNVPNNNGNTDEPEAPSATLEQILIFKSDRPIKIGFSALGLYTLYLNDQKIHSTYHKGSEILANTETKFHFKAIGHPYNLSITQIELVFSLLSREVFEKDPDLDNKPNPLKPITTMVSFTWQEKIGGKITREDSETITLSEDNNWEYESKKYETKYNV